MATSFLDPYGGDQAAPIVERRFLDFLENFQMDPQGDTSSDSVSMITDSQEAREYVLAVRGMQAQEMTTLFVDFMHLRVFDSTLASTIAAEFYR